MRDPLSGYQYPAEWVERCRDAALLHLAETGLAVLTASGTVLRRGYTTGTTAAAVVAGSILSLTGRVQEVRVLTPGGIEVTVPVTAYRGRATTRKFGGDHPADVTAGIEICAEATPADRITITAGEGIGRWVRDTTSARAGEPAISPPASACIQTAATSACRIIGIPGSSVCITVPEGLRVAHDTLNERVGVHGGISLLGTTGLVEPWDDHLRESTLERVAAVQDPVVTSGRTGLRFARMRYPDREVLLVGTSIREAIARAQGHVTLFGLPALILRAIEPSILEGSGYATVEEFSMAAEFPARARQALARFRRDHPRVTVVLIDRNGTTIAESG
jgi:cobalt-precorrin-5B (C1)-methyltransferase